MLFRSGWPPQLEEQLEQLVGKKIELRDTEVQRQAKSAINLAMASMQFLSPGEAKEALPAGQESLQSLSIKRVLEEV